MSLDTATGSKVVGVVGFTFDQFEQYAENLILQHLSSPQPNCSTLTKVVSKIDKKGRRLDEETQFKFRLIPDEIGFPKSVLYHFIMISGGMVVTENDEHAVNILNDLHFILREDKNVTLPPDTYSSSLIFEAIKRKIMDLPFPNPKAHLVSPSQYEPYDLLKILRREVKWSSLKKVEVDSVVSAQEVAHVSYQVLASTTAEKFLSVTREAESQPTSSSASLSSLPHSSSPITTAPGQNLTSIVPHASKKNATPSTAPKTSRNESDLASPGTGIARTEVCGRSISTDKNKQAFKETATPKSSDTTMVTTSASKLKPLDSAPFSKKQNIVTVATKANTEGSLSLDKQKQSVNVPENRIGRSTETKDPSAIQLPLQLQSLAINDTDHYCKEENGVTSIRATPEETSASRNSTPGTVILKYSLRKRKNPVVADTKAEAEPSPSRNPTAPDNESEQCGFDPNVELVLDSNEGSSSISTRARSIGEESKTPEPGPDLKTPEKSSVKKSPRKLDFSPALSPPANSSRKSNRRAKADDADCARANDDDDKAASSPQPVPPPTVNERKEKPIVEIKIRGPAFTTEEDILIIKNICKVEAFMYTGGKRLFELMSNSEAFKGKRSGDSLLDRWRKHIKPKLLDKKKRSTFAKKWNVSSSDLKNILEGLQESKLNLHSNIAPDYKFD